MQFNRWVAAVLSLVLSVGAAVGCGGNASIATDNSAGSRPGGGSVVPGTATVATGSYSDEVRSNFLMACTGSFEGPATTLTSRAYCRCVYDYFVNQVPYADFEKLEAALKDDPSLGMSADITRTFRLCRDTTSNGTEPHDR